MEKKSGGLIGIARIASALSRWILSYNLRIIITQQTKTMLKLSTDDDDYVHNVCTMSRMATDEKSEGRLIEALKEHGVFNPSGETLQNIVNKDMVTRRIQESLLNAESLGKDQLKPFVTARLCKHPSSQNNVTPETPISKNKALTFASLYVVTQNVKGQENI